jgi:hypothetical protein
MRINVQPILEKSGELLAAIEAKSLSRSASSADALLKLLPSPMWAETAPGCAIYYPGEKDTHDRINMLRRNVMRWMDRFVDPEISQESDDEWPVPTKLAEMVRRLSSPN